MKISPREAKLRDDWMDGKLKTHLRDMSDSGYIGSLARCGAATAGFINTAKDIECVDCKNCLKLAAKDKEKT